MLLLIWPLLLSAASACTYKGQKYENGEQWTARSSFVMQCKIEDDGSWVAQVVGCKTPQGKLLQPGEQHSESETQFVCARTETGTIQIQRNYKPVNVASCEGHQVGESWISKTNFNKTCFSNGTRIMNCLSDTGIPIPLNSKYFFSSVTYRCTELPNGTVIISRESVPVKPASEKKITCSVNGVAKNVGESWVEDDHFVKRCDDRGVAFIEACILDNSTQLFVNSKMSRDGKVYFCNKNADGTVFFSVQRP